MVEYPGDPHLSAEEREVWPCGACNRTPDGHPTVTDQWNVEAFRQAQKFENRRRRIRRATAFGTTIKIITIIPLPVNEPK